MRSSYNPPTPHPKIKKKNKERSWLRSQNTRVLLVTCNFPAGDIQEEASTEIRLNNIFIVLCRIWCQSTQLRLTMEKNSTRFYPRTRAANVLNDFKDILYKACP